jgi:glyoxylase-like metal-dependent hydrolase (beta-lactamase superfamily II)
MKTMAARRITRREILRGGALLASEGFVAGLVPEMLRTASGGVVGSRAKDGLQQGSSADRLAQMRAQGSAIPLETQKLRDNIYWLHGPGGNMVVLDGPEGKILVDSSYLPVAPKLKASLDAIGNAPVKILVNTHWHFDHTDGNGPIHQAGAMICAHENTRKRLSIPQDVAAFGLHFDPAPADAWPAQTFEDSMRLYFNGEGIHMGYIQPAHTDGDIFVRYAKGNVLHMGDVYFSEFYPFIDKSTGGSIDGMIAGASQGLTLADSETKIVPGHGPVTDKAALAKYRDMLVTVRDRVQAKKRAGASVEETVASKPTADLDAVWGGGLVKADLFVGIVYSTL